MAYNGYMLVHRNIYLGSKIVGLKHTNHLIEDVFSFLINKYTSTNLSELKSL